MTDNYITTSKAAAILGIHENTFRRADWFGLKPIRPIQNIQLWREADVRHLKEALEVALLKHEADATRQAIEQANKEIEERMEQARQVVADAQARAKVEMDRQRREAQKMIDDARLSAQLAGERWKAEVDLQRKKNELELKQAYAALLAEGIAALQPKRLK